MNLFERAHLLLSPELYRTADPEPICLSNMSVVLKPPRGRQYILRMMLRDERGVMLIPRQLRWLQPWISGFSHHQEIEFGRNLPFVYVTVRHGICTSETDDLWHVDGFSMRKPHVPEQNYLFVSEYPTEFLTERIPLPNDFDPLQHNIHQFFQQHAGRIPVRTYPPVWMIADPYIVHRRPPDAAGKRRLMIRITFSPIQIKDDMNTVNPLLPTKKFDNTDFRQTLTQYNKQF